MNDVFNHVRQLCDEYDGAQRDPEAAADASVRFAREARTLLPLLAEVVLAASDDIETARTGGWPLLRWREEADRKLAAALAHLEQEEQERVTGAAPA